MRRFHSSNISSFSRKIIAGVTAFFSSLIIGFWSYWGINEAFHEGWYYQSLWQNLSLTSIQYLSVPFVFLLTSLIALNYKKTGLSLFLSLGIFALFFFNSNAGRALIFVPMILFALGFYFGEFKSKKIISSVFKGIFLIILLTFGIPHLIRVETRFNDQDFGTRTIFGNGVSLTWAAQGVGFPLDGTDWETAQENCAKLNESGETLLQEEVNLWRLPSREEIVRSLTRKNQNSLGFIAADGVAQYQMQPDKETPLWNPHSEVIYYWTAESKDAEKAFLVAYNGYILARNKSFGPNYQGYRCVKK